METDIDDYLKSNDALHQTESAQGHLLHPDETIGGFRVVAFLGRGATGEVWRVHDESLNSDFAMKIFAPSETNTEKETARLRRRFIAEARCLAQFTHPGIVRVHVLQAEGEHPFYTMDLLHPIVRPLARRKSRKIIGDVLSALITLHAKGIVHRDIKPANVLLDDGGNAVLTDFGIAQIDDAETAAQVVPDGGTTTATGGMRIAGTPDFSAPEQFIGADATPASDLHAVGRLALWLFDGRPPLSWRWFVMRATNSSPALRYGSAKAMKRALHAVQFLETFPVAVACTGAAAILSQCAVLFRASGPPECREPKPLSLNCADIAWTNILCRYDFLDKSAEHWGMVITLKDGQTYEKDLLKGGLTWVHTADLRKHEFKHHQVRRPFIIQGRGTLRAKTIVEAEVHLMPGVKLVTSGEYHGFSKSVIKPAPGRIPDWTTEKEPYDIRPGRDVSITNDNDVIYASYIVEPGAELVFTDNPDYPESLIDRR